MSARAIRGIRLAPAACDLLVCAAAFWAASRIFDSTTADWPAAIAISAAASWLGAISLQGRESGVSLWVDQLLYAAGLTMLLQYGLAYAVVFSPAPLAAIVLGAALSVLSMAMLHARVYPKLWEMRSSVLFLGFDSTAAALAPVFRRGIAGVVASDPSGVPADLRFLGGPEQLPRIVAENSPCRVVATGRYFSPRALLELHYSGTTVVAGEALHERLLGRLRWDAIRPVDLLFSRSTNADRLGMAVQAIYTNVIGLALLLALSPLLLLIAACTALAGGRVLERSECLGFQMVPFSLLSFGTLRADGRRHWIGKTISALRLTRLPRLMNVVRGEMAFFGPPPVRYEFARRLGGSIPVYAHRFTIKPGIMGWSQVNLAGIAGVSDEALRLEYDLYYIKQNSVSLDLEILVKTLFPLRSAAGREARGQLAGES